MALQLQPQTQTDPATWVLEAIDNDPNLADSTKTKYRRAIQRYTATGESLTDAEALARYAAKASRSERSFLSAVITKLCDHIERYAKGSATPENITAAHAAVYRVDALRQTIEVKQSKGTTGHTWLSQKEVKALLDTCDDDIVGQRDRLALGLLVSAGLRRREAAEFRFEDVTLKPVEDKLRTVLEIHGKGDKFREVPISDELANAIDRWAKTIGESEGRVLRSLGRDRDPGDSMSTTALYNLVRKHGAAIGKPDLAPHDLRRTYAQIGHEAGIPIAQISTLLGHSSIETTMRYLNLDIDYDVTISDFVPF